MVLLYIVINFSLLTSSYTRTSDRLRRYSCQYIKVHCVCVLRKKWFTSVFNSNGHYHLIIWNLSLNDADFFDSLFLKFISFLKCLLSDHALVLKHNRCIGRMLFYLCIFYLCIFLVWQMCAGQRGPRIFLSHSQQAWKTSNVSNFNA